MNEIIEATPAAPQAITPIQPQPMAPSALLQLAITNNASMDTLERLMALQERHEANEARKAFVQAMANLKSEPLEIFKRKTVAFETKGGDTTSYKHAELSDVVDVVVPAMARHGLSHRWDTRRDQGRLFVKCIVTHRLGHSESLELDGAPDDSGKKNNIQQMASTITYLQRYTLLGIVGLATKSEEDDDGAGGAPDAGGSTDPVDAYKGPLADLLRELVFDMRKETEDAKVRDFYMKNRAQLQADKPAYEIFKEATAARRQALKYPATSGA